MRRRYEAKVTSSWKFGRYFYNIVFFGLDFGFFFSLRFNIELTSILCVKKPMGLVVRLPMGLD